MGEQSQGEIKFKRLALNMDRRKRVGKTSALHCMMKTRGEGEKGFLMSFALF